MDLSPAKPWDAEAHAYRVERLRAEARYFQALAAWHYELAQIMLRHYGTEDGAFPIDQFLWAMAAQADLSRMARRALFATIGTP